jgi:hypothetical protein
MMADLKFPDAWKVAEPKMVTDVFCPDCGTCLGTQAGDAPVQPEMWKHNGCPAAVARDLGVPRSDYETAKRVVNASITSSYPELPAFRSELASDAMLAALAAAGLVLMKK